MSALRIVVDKMRYPNVTITTNPPIRTVTSEGADGLLTVYLPRGYVGEVRAVSGDTVVVTLRLQDGHSDR